MIARVPASSANLGPGFDALGMALGLHAEMGIMADGTDLPEGARAVDRHHPGSVAFAELGGIGELWERCSIPVGRGLGFSGAVRVAGGVLAVAQRTGTLGAEGRAEVMDVVARLEGHPDNVAASLYGGVVVAAGGRVVPVRLGIDPAIVVWIPSFVTRTDESRKALPTSVTLADAAFNIGRVALLVAALADGDVSALRLATDDRLHQPVRLAAAEPSGAAMQAAVDAGAWCSWLSGSGPTVAAMCPMADAERIAVALPADGRARVLRIDHEGATVEAPYT